jgi:hypothetical protein
MICLMTLAAAQTVMRRITELLLKRNGKDVEGSGHWLI